MNIDEIRAEVKSAFASLAATQRWIGDKLGTYELDGDTNCEIAARLLVDWAYEAGKAEGQYQLEREIDLAYQRGKETGIALKEADLAENWNEGYKRGYNDAEKEKKKLIDTIFEHLTKRDMTVELKKLSEAE